MGIKIKFEQYGNETVYNPQSPTFVLMTRSGERIGVLEPTDANVKSYLNSADEVSFRVYREVSSNKTYYSQPEPPYSVGDVYIDGLDSNATAGRAIA